MTENTKDQETKDATKDPLKESAQKATEYAREWVEKGNVRHVVFRSRSGKKFAEMSLTLAVVLGVIALFTFFWLVVPAAIIAYFMGIRVEILREVEDEGVVNVSESNGKAEH